MDANRERLRVLNVLQDFSDRIGSLMSLISGCDANMPNDVKAVARSEYKQIKADLAREAKRWETRKGHQGLTETEDAYLQPATSNASCRLMAATNTHPILSDWYSQLYDAKGGIDFLLQSLQRQVQGNN